MEHLTLGDILDLAVKIKKATGLTGAEIRELPVYVTDDDEMNGVHTGWGYAYLDRQNADEDTQYIIDLIDENRCNVKMKDRAVLIG